MGVQRSGSPPCPRNSRRSAPMWRTMRCRPDEGEIGRWAGAFFRCGPATPSSGVEGRDRPAPPLGPGAAAAERIGRKPLAQPLCDLLRKTGPLLAPARGSREKLGALCALPGEPGARSSPAAGGETPGSL